MEHGSIRAPGELARSGDGAKWHCVRSGRPSGADDGGGSSYGDMKIGRRCRHALLRVDRPSLDAAGRPISLRSSATSPCGIGDWVFPPLLRVNTALPSPPRRRRRPVPFPAPHSLPRSPLPSPLPASFPAPFPAPFPTRPARRSGADGGGPVSPRIGSPPPCSRRSAAANPQPAAPSSGGAGGGDPATGLSARPRARSPSAGVRRAVRGGGDPTRAAAAGGRRAGPWGCPPPRPGADPGRDAPLGEPAGPAASPHLRRPPGPPPLPCRPHPRWRRRRGPRAKRPYGGRPSRARRAPGARPGARGAAARRLGDRGPGACGPGGQTRPGRAGPSLSPSRLFRARAPWSTRNRAAPRVGRAPGTRMRGWVDSEGNSNRVFGRAARRVGWALGRWAVAATAVWRLRAGTARFVLRRAGRGAARRGPATRASPSRRNRRLAPRAPRLPPTVDRKQGSRLRRTRMPTNTIRGAVLYLDCSPTAFVHHS